MQHSNNAQDEAFEQALSPLFGTLPAEIRLRIVELAIGGDQVVHLALKRHGQPSAILGGSPFVWGWEYKVCSLPGGVQSMPNPLHDGEQVGEERLSLVYLRTCRRAHSETPKIWAFRNTTFSLDANIGYGDPACGDPHRVLLRGILCMTRPMYECISKLELRQTENMLHHPGNDFAHNKAYRIMWDKCAANLLALKTLRVFYTRTEESPIVGAGDAQWWLKPVKDFVERRPDMDLVVFTLSYDLMDDDQFPAAYSILAPVGMSVRVWTDEQGPSWVCAWMKP